MCLHPLPFASRMHVDTPSTPPPPDCHLVIEARPLVGRVRAVMETLLRVDLGARIQINAPAGRIEVEGRFHGEDACRAIQRMGLDLVRVEERPRSRKAAAPARSWSVI